jgi:hypothetical protein
MFMPFTLMWIKIGSNCITVRLLKIKFQFLEEILPLHLNLQLMLVFHPQYLAYLVDQCDRPCFYFRKNVSSLFSWRHNNARPLTWTEKDTLSGTEQRRHNNNATR